QLVAHGPDVLLDILAALDDASPLAANYLRSAFETIADRSLASGKQLPAPKLEAFVRDTRHKGSARRLAYELLARLDPTAPDRLVPGMLNDPGAELRREAVFRLVQAARKQLDSKDKAAAVKAYREVLKYARDRDQVQEAAKQLDQLGEKVDLTRHFGF